MTQFREWESKREYKRFKRTFHSKCFDGSMGFVEYIKYWFQIRKNTKQLRNELSLRKREREVRETAKAKVALIKGRHAHN